MSVNQAEFVDFLLRPESVWGRPLRIEEEKRDHDCADGADTRCLNGCLCAVQVIFTSSTAGHYLNCILSF